MKFLKEYGQCTGPLDFPMSEDAARELEKGLSSGEWSPITIQKSDSFETSNVAERSDVSVITDGSIDKDGEIIDPVSLNWDNFKKNPVVAFNHRYDLPPIGKSLWQKLCPGNIWKAKTQYISRPDTHPKETPWLPDSIFHMIKSGSLRGKSIGGAVKWREITKNDLEKNPSFSTAKRITEKVNIYEYSVVTIASNNNAIVEEISKGFLKMPEEILQNEFPEVYIAIKDMVKVLPVVEIKNFKTSESFIEEQEDIFKEGVENMKNSLPSLVNDAFNRCLGRVA